MGKRIMFIVLLLTTLVGCNTSRYVERDTTERIDFSQSDIVSVIKMANYNQSILDSVLSIRNITFRIYDTEKPPNEDGQFPVLMEGELRDSTVSNHTVETKETVRVARNDSTVTNINIDKEQHIKKDIQVRTGIANVVCLVVIILPILFSITIFNKHNN